MNALKNKIGNYLYADDMMFEKTFGARKFIVLIASAYDSGIMGSEYNGIVVIDEDNKKIVLDRHLCVPSGYYGPSQDQKKEFEKIKTMDWQDFAQFCSSNPRYRGQISDIKNAQPDQFEPEVDRIIYPVSDNSEVCPLQSRREILQFLTEHQVHRIDNSMSKWALAWNIKISSFNTDGIYEGFNPDKEYHEKWQEFISHDTVFWNAASDAISIFTDDEYTLGEDSAAKWEFATSGRSGGWLVLTHCDDFEEQPLWHNKKDMETYLKELQDNQLVMLYRLVSQVDIQTSNPEQTMQYQYAVLRENMENIWKTEKELTP